MNLIGTTVADEIEREIPVSNMDPLSYLESLYENQYILVMPFTSTEVENVIASLKMRGGLLDEIPSFIF